ncbi:hypothetical protein [Actinomadura verrucosospora]|uniref:Lipoprotein n=1 Tax=Actinomadura verrucosospora TaxID=46165 RepID=A0A7D4AUL8_ACTVE|nr:hypothetical protein [Actinomadura verrucosospora]QKG26348.1 hypothetical protein ACTIVE_8001 [Actinomadura verrucosospora]
MDARHIVATALTAGLLAACTSHPHHRTAPTPSGTKTAPPTPTSPSPSPSRTGLPHPKDGHDLSACRDARCEVVVSSGDRLVLAPKYRIGPVRINVAHGSVDFRSTSADGFQTEFLDQTPDQGGPSTFNEVDFAVTAVQGKKAVIKLTHH